MGREARTDQAGTFIHQVLPYASDTDLVERAAPPAIEGLAEGHAVIVAVDARHLAPLREAIGPGARYEDAASWYRRPGKTLAAYHAFVTGALEDGAPGVRIVGEPAWPDGPPALVRAWARYESAINDVLAREPVWAICPYDTRRLPPTLVSEAMRTHPATTDGTTGRYMSPGEFVGSPPEDPPPADAAWFLMPSPFDLRRARDAVAEVARATGMKPVRVASLTVAVGEVLANALRHGRTAAQVWTWTEPGMGLVVQVDDEGRGIADPLAGYRPPSPETGRWGLWMARQMADVVDVWVRPGGGTSVRLAMTA